jgi:hypothetical protein
MGKLSAKQVIAYSKAEPKKYSDGEGLCFCVRKQGSPYWIKFNLFKHALDVEFEPPQGMGQQRAVINISVAVYFVSVFRLLQSSTW